ncbi:PREDICTED: borealin-2-like [Nanorana parkeri]|uniref:borealin-2-like n=1 Tax=Nanorana parkeri TaxID=125878 RepID=UPI0008544C12|nr:PREDICTED: borealin-2-like [Nanorana parkeri]
MHPKRTRKQAGNRAKGSGDSGLGLADPLQEQKNEKIRLFMLDFIQQRKDRIEEVKKELEVLDGLPDQIMEVELLKMPVSIRQMKVGDYYKLMEANKVEEAALAKADSLEEELREVKLVRKNSKRVKMTTTTEYHDPVHAKVTSTTQKSRTVPKITKSKSFVGDSAKKPAMMRLLIYSSRSISATPLGKAPRKALLSTSSCRPEARNTRSTRSRAMSSLGEHQPLMDGFPLLHIPLLDGQTLSSAVDDLDSVNVELLRADTVQHIHNLVGQLTNLCTKAYKTSQ